MNVLVKGKLMGYLVVIFGMISSTLFPVLIQVAELVKL